MIKMTMMLKRNPKLTHEEFVKHHIEKHGQLFKQIPEAKKHCVRYIQTHPIKQETDVGDVGNFDGTAELWFDNLEGLENTLNSQFYKDKVFPDEKKFLDHENTFVTIGNQVEIISD